MLNQEERRHVAAEAIRGLRAGFDRSMPEDTFYTKSELLELLGKIAYRLDVTA